MKRFILLLVASAAGTLFSLSSRAAPAEIIAKARAFVGTEAALEAIKSVHYLGVLETVDEAEGEAKPLKLGIEIIFQKPYEQRIVVTAEKNIETTALDDYEAWRRQQDPADPSNWRLSLLNGDQVKRLRANAWENLAFFRGLEVSGGAVEDRGEVELAGIKCRKIAFIHEPTIIFIRYFDEKTGQLVLTETEQGGTIREEGELVVGGVRFPKKIVTANKGKNDREQIVTITFEKISVNEEFPPNIFRVPMMQPSSEAKMPTESTKASK